MDQPHLLGEGYRESRLLPAGYDRPVRAHELIGEGRCPDDVCFRADAGRISVARDLSRDPFVEFCGAFQRLRTVTAGENLI